MHLMAYVNIKVGIDNEHQLDVAIGQNTGAFEFVPLRHAFVCPFVLKLMFAVLSVDVLDGDGALRIDRRAYCVRMRVRPTPVIDRALGNLRELSHLKKTASMHVSFGVLGVCHSVIDSLGPPLWRLLSGSLERTHMSELPPRCR